MAEKTTSGNATDTFYEMEFKWKDDDAWYSVRVELSDDGELTVKFLGFTEVWDVKYTAGGFRSEGEVEELVKRFRPVSDQVQDEECSGVHEGMKVCAAHSHGVDDLRFYDAVVDAVHHEEHSSEECSCTFILCWLHGPNNGNLSAASIANICKVKSSGEIDPRIASFSRMVKEKVKNNSRLVVSDITTSALEEPLHVKEVSCLPPGISTQPGHQANDMKTSSDNASPETLFTTESLSTPGEQERYIDKDLGGDEFVRYGGPHYFIVDNLKSDLSPSSIRHFIRIHTSVSAEAYVFPRQSSVPYACAAIVSDSKTELETVYNFVLNPEHLIVSSSGRPWVLIEHGLRHGTFEATRGRLAMECRDESLRGDVSCALRIVQSGTEEYQKAMEVKSLFMQFVAHEEKLYERLAMKESRILEAS